MRNGELASPPNPRRSSVGILSDGTLDVRRVSLRGTWKGDRAPPALPPQRAAGRRRRGACSRLPSAAQHRRCRARRRRSSSRFPLATPGVDLAATVAEVVDGSVPVPIPIGGAVLARLGCPGAGTRGRGARRLAGRRPARLRPDLGRPRLCRRRRAAARQRRAAGGRSERVVHAAPARAPGAAERRRSTRERARDPRRGRRPPAGLQRRAHERRARAHDGRARCDPGDGVRQRRVDDDRVRRNAAQPSLGRSRATRRLGSRAPVRRRVPAHRRCR